MEERFENRQAICESRESLKIVKFVLWNELGDRFCEDAENGNVWGVYYNEAGNLVCETKDGETYELADC